jgi:hypothetical protein
MAGRHQDDFDKPAGNSKFLRNGSRRDRRCALVIMAVFGIFLI